MVSNLTRTFLWISATKSIQTTASSSLSLRYLKLAKTLPLNNVYFILRFLRQCTYFDTSYLQYTLNVCPLIKEKKRNKMLFTKGFN